MHRIFCHLRKQTESSITLVGLHVFLSDYENMSPFSVKKYNTPDFLGGAF